MKECIHKICFMIWVRGEVNCEGASFALLLGTIIDAKMEFLESNWGNLCGLPVCAWHVNLNTNTIAHNHGTTKYLAAV